MPDEDLAGDDRPTFVLRALPPTEPGSVAPNDERPSGVIQLTANSDYSEIRQFLTEIREDGGDDVTVDARAVMWAGPYEVLLSVTHFIEAVGVLATGTGSVIGGVAGLLALYKKKHPDKSIEVRLPDGSHLAVTGELDPTSAKLINDLFDANRADLNELNDYGPGTTPI